MTNEQRRQHQRLLRYQAIISNTLDEVGQRLEALAINIPNDIDSMKLNDKQVIPRNSNKYYIHTQKLLLSCIYGTPNTHPGFD